MHASLETRARLACLYAGAVWGLFWIPLRSLEEGGLHSLWVTVVYFAVPTVCLIPLTVMRWKQVWSGGVGLQLTALISGGALFLYSTSIIYTDVVRAILMFYLTPVWGTILARWILGDAITPLRIVAMGFGIVGMLTIFGLGARFPLPQNIGDWLGLASGMAWAVAMVRIRMDDTHSAIDMTVGFFQWSLVLALGTALVLAPQHVPEMRAVVPSLPLLLAFMIVLILPGTYASLWGPKHLSPGIVGLLFMPEIVVGAISVALLAGEPLGWREILGIVFIMGASLLEPLVAVARAR